MLVGKLAMLDSRGCVFLSIFVLAERVVMLRLMMMVRGRMVVNSRLVMMLARWMRR
jgi:hypothetical protein